MLIASSGGVTRLTLNRPDKLNAFNGHARRAAGGAGQRGGDPHCRAVLLTGAGRGFCAGQDLADRVLPAAASCPMAAARSSNAYNPLVRLHRALQKPVICAVNGVAAGAGANIALACDIVLAARTASFLQAFAKIGLVPDSGGTWLLPRLVGPARARGPGAARRAAAGREGRGLGHDLEGASTTPS